MKGNPLSEPASDLDQLDDSHANLHAKINSMQSEGEEFRRQTEQRIILAEMKVEAVRAGIVDLDGLRLLNLSELRLSDDGDVIGGKELITQLKHAKPWLFSIPSSSSFAKAPPSKPIRQKLATEMTDDEYRIARANILSRSLF